MEMFDILKTAVESQASDIHIIVNMPPMMRVYGEMKPMQMDVLTAEEAKRLVYGILYDEQKQFFEEHWELDCSFQIPNLSRFRVNVLLQKDGIGAVLRVISSKIPEPEEIRLPQTVIDFANLPNGMVLVTGPTGSGKSTTLACLIDFINRRHSGHIITIEDPIEFVYEKKNCVINQREVGAHTHSFEAALKHALRQDPDVVLVGEMRDLETISTALTIAETGHLVFATLHTTDAAQTIDRIVDVFPPFQQQQIRVQLSVILRGVVCQQLIPHVSGKGRVASREIMVCTPAIANLIREGKTHQIYSAIETGQKFGMLSGDRALANLVKEGLVKKEDVMMKAHNPETIENYIRGVQTYSAAAGMVK